MAREKGYIVTIKAFVAVNPRDLTDTVAKATALQNAKQGGSLKDLADLGAEIMTVDQRFTSREKAAQEAAEGPDEAPQPDDDATEEEQEGDPAPAENGRRRRA